MSEEEDQYKPISDAEFQALSLAEQLAHSRSEMKDIVKGVNTTLIALRNHSKIVDNPDAKVVLDKAIMSSENLLNG